VIPASVSGAGAQQSPGWLERIADAELSRRMAMDAGLE
jgi:hypothetical protein